MEGKSVSMDIKSAAGQFVKEKKYWINQLTGEIEMCHFPYDNYKELVAGEYRKDAVRFEINGDIYARLMEITGGAYPKILMVLVAGAASLSAQYTGNRDMIVGSAIERQDTQVTQDSENLLINSILPLRVSMPVRMTFKELIIEIRKTINEAIENQNYPIETLPPLHEKLIDVVVLLENIQDKKYVEHLHCAITFTFRATGAQVEGELEYDTSKYEKKSITRIINHFLHLLRIALFDVNVKIIDIELFSEEDKKELRCFNNTYNDYPHQKTIYELFEEQVEKTPDNIAVVGANDELPEQITYRGLNERANRLAQVLSQKGIEPGNFVAIMMERSIDMITGIIGILKAGAAYLPLDLEYPEDRIQYILEDSRANMLLKRSEIRISKLETNPIAAVLNFEDLNLEFEPEFCVSNGNLCSSSLAYVIYTSGSTGKPKGVAVEHRSLVNYTWWAAKNYVKNEKVDFPLYTSIGFDLTITSLFTPLITGNTIYIYRGESKEFLLENILAENRVDVVKLTPVHLMIMGDNIKEKNISKIKRFIVGGDKLESQWAHDIHHNLEGNIEIYNEYGPTEATVGCMIYKYDPRKDKGISVPIGVPADNVQIYLLDKLNRNVPVGGIGELYIGGDGLARGYLNNPGLTAEKFIPNPFGAGKKIYKTGDTARRLVGGDIEFLGRIDQQVKIRGYRIETGEIENYLSKYENINQAVVVAKEDGNGYKYLAGYIVLDGKGKKTNIDTGELRNYLSKHLPEFMIPSYFVKLEKIPVTANGKIDKKSLPDPDKNALDTGTDYQPPTTELEKLLVEIWQAVMDVERIGITDSYFALGGDSIKSIQISARLHNFGWKLELKDLFQYTIIKELANHIKPVKEISYQGIIEGEVRLTPIQEWFFEHNFTDEHHFNLSVMLHRSEGFAEPITKKTFNKLVEHHDVLRTIFKREGGKIKQINRGISDDLVDIRVFDLRSENDYKKVIEEKCSELQESIDLSCGPLVKLGLFKSKNGDYLLIVIHHLVMDTVSWRILFEDFISLYRQLEAGIEKEKLELPLKSTSYKEWAEKLYEYSNSEGLREELKYWQKIENLGPVAHSKNKGNGMGKNKDSKDISFELAEEYTGKLLKQVNFAYNTEINDILLAALGMAFCDWTGVEEVPIMLEGHGREEIVSGVNITRTVGWFTSVFPIVLNMKNKKDESSIIKDTKEKLRNVPFKGIGYGILRYLTREENRQGIKLSLTPEISFNYLGQFDDSVRSEFFKVADISAGNSISLNMERIYPLYISGSVFNGKLRISVSYDAGNYEESEIRIFLDGYERWLLQMIDHCATKEDTEYTLSDYSAPIDEQEAELVFDILNDIELEG